MFSVQILIVTLVVLAPLFSSLGEEPRVALAARHLAAAGSDNDLFEGFETAGRLFVAQVRLTALVVAFAVLAMLVQA